MAGHHTGCHCPCAQWVNYIAWVSAAVTNTADMAPIFEMPDSERERDSTALPERAAGLEEPTSGPLVYLPPCGRSAQARVEGGSCADHRPEVRKILPEGRVGRHKSSTTLNLLPWCSCHKVVCSRHVRGLCKVNGLLKFRVSEAREVAQWLSCCSFRGLGFGSSTPMAAPSHF